jgi:nucleoside-diphosphate-sugar epimerase
MAPDESTVDRPLIPSDEVLIVGGAGLIGSFLARALIGAGLRPIVVSRSDPQPGIIPDGTSHLRMDRIDLPKHIQSWTQRPLGVVEVLAEGPAEIAPLLAATAPFPGRFVAIGSASVLGRSPRGIKHDERSLPAPHTEVMARKLGVERLLAEHHRRGRACFTLRCAYPYGPGHGPMTPLGRDRELFRKLEHHQQITWIEPEALAPIQPLWAGDLAQAIVALLTLTAKPEPLYNVAGPEVMSWDGYLEVLARDRWPQRRLERPSLAELLERAPDAWWLEKYLPKAPLLDDSLIRRHAFAPLTTLAEVVEDWANWCKAGELG